MHEGWTDTDREILALLEREGAVSPDEIGHRLGMSEGEATALVCMLAREGKVRIRLVQSASSAPAPERTAKDNGRRPVAV